MKRIVKRGMDVVGSTAGLVLMLPVLILAALFVLFTLGRPIFFRQLRAGRAGRVFWLYKFRTMSNSFGEEGKLLPDEHRLVKTGQLLRKVSIDELPQLWNVLKGDMSLIGPRPLLPEYLLRYTEFQRRRQEVRPGVTGWAQVNGRNQLDWNQRFELDVWYIDHWSLWLDLRILWLTLFAVLLSRGISQDGHATMSEFVGSSSGRGAHT